MVYPRGWRIIEMEKRIASEPLTEQFLWEAKRFGFSDAQIAQLGGKAEEDVRSMRYEAGITPVFKMVDTCAAEFEAATPYY